jgi:Tol biopolymer transport system component
VTLTPGTRLGPYEITAPIGAGGMGEVYRASDTRLQREVAIKVLPAAFSGNAQLRARFDREARAISSLNHPNICTLYDVGHQDGVDFLVMELIEGEPLADRLARGPLPVADVLRYGIEIADALDKAHRRAIVHRDLKPGNVIITRAGAKLLDFGLAKSMSSAVVDVSPASETMHVSERPLTAEGTIVGTFQYMAPEQVEGVEADARSDLFALGCVLYEMATGKRAFSGKSRASLIAQILEHDPEPISAVQPLAPRALERVVRTCLQKNPDDRFQTAHDVVLELRWIRDDVSQPEIPAPLVRRRARRERAAWGIAALAALAAIGTGIVMQRRDAGVHRDPLRASVTPPAGTRFFFTGDYGGPAVLSPDGRRLAFVVAADDGKRQLYVRSLDSSEARAIAGTDGARFPFFSPDGKSIGFFADLKLKTVDVAGGSPVVIADAGDPRGGTWNEEGVIVFAPVTREGLFRVNADGGPVTPVTTVDRAQHTTHRWPLFLPDGKHVVYLAANHNQYDHPATALYLASLDGKENRRLLRTLANVEIVGDEIFYLRENHLMAQRFDGKTVSAKPRLVVENVRFDPGTWRAIFSVSPTLLMYQSGGKTSGSEVVTFERSGRVVSTLPPDRYVNLSLSPDGGRLAVDIGDPAGNIWIIDLVRSTRTRLTFEGGLDVEPVWADGGRTIIYASRDKGKFAVFRKPADGSGARELLASQEKLDVISGHIHPNGKDLVVTVGAENTPEPPYIATLSLAGERKLTPFIKGPAAMYDPQFSPDGRWVTYVSDESRREEVYVVAFPARPGKWQISANGGRHPLWRGDGRELYYVAADNTITAVAVDPSGATLGIGASRPLFRIDLAQENGQSYDVSSDGQHFYVNSGTRDLEPLTIITNWRQNANRM